LVFYLFYKLHKQDHSSADFFRFQGINEKLTPRLARLPRSVKTLISVIDIHFNNSVQYSQFLWYVIITTSYRQRKLLHNFCGSVLTMTVFWSLAPYSLADTDRHLGKLTTFVIRLMSILWLPDIAHSHLLWKANLILSNINYHHYYCHRSHLYENHLLGFEREQEEILRFY
jgi:hypothetical protein